MMRRSVIRLMRVQRALQLRKHGSRAAALVAALAVGGSALRAAVVTRDDELDDDNEGGSDLSDELLAAGARDAEAADGACAPRAGAGFLPLWPRKFRSRARAPHRQGRLARRP